MWLAVFLFRLIVSFPTKSGVVQGREIQSLNDTRIFVWRKSITPAMHRKSRKTAKPLSVVAVFPLSHRGSANPSRHWPHLRMEEHPLALLLLVLTSWQHPGVSKRCLSFGKRKLGDRR